MVKPRYLIGITGRRRLHDPDPVRTGLAAILREVQELVARRGGRLELYGSIAYGTDTIAAQEARKLDIPVHLILPKPVVQDEQTGAIDLRAGFAADFWKGPPDQGGTFRELEWNEACTEIRLAAAGHNGGTLRLTFGSQIDPECYYDAGLQVLEAADILLAVLDDQPDKGLAGARSVVTLAELRELPLVILPASGGEPERRRLNQLAPEDEGRELIAQVDAFSTPCASADAETEETAGELFGRLEACSRRDAGQFRNSVVRVIKFHGAATLVAATAALLPQTSLFWKLVLAALAALELCLVAWALWRRRQLTGFNGIHDRWLQTRFAVELMRAMKHSVGLLDPLHPLIARRQPRWRRFALTAALLVRLHQPSRPWQEARDIYVRDRLRHPDIRLGQITYFTTKRREAEPRFRLALRWGTILGRAALIFVIGALINKCWSVVANIHELWHPEFLANSDQFWVTWILDIAFKFLPIALPLLAGIFMSLRTALDSGRRTYRYQEVADRLIVAAGILETLETESAVRRTVYFTEEVLLDELVEWHHAEEQNGAH